MDDGTVSRRIDPRFTTESLFPWASRRAFLAALPVSATSSASNEVSTRGQDPRSTPLTVLLTDGRFVAAGEKDAVLVAWI